MLKSLKRMIPESLKKPVSLYLHKGDKYHCPLCGYQAKDLYPIGLKKTLPVLTEKQIVGAGRRNAGFYNCSSTDRGRLIFLYLKEKLKIFKDDKKWRILHIAPEKNLSEFIIRSGVENYICGDLLNQGYIYPSFVQDMNLLDLPFENDSFDLLICNHVLEHIPDDIMAMREIYRVLQPGGEAILQVPISKNSAHTREDFSVTSPEQRELLFGQFDHVRIYGQDYSERLNWV